MLAYNGPTTEQPIRAYWGSATCAHKPWILTGAIFWNPGSISVILHSLEFANAGFTPVWKRTSLWIEMPRPLSPLSWIQGHKIHRYVSTDYMWAKFNVAILPLLDRTPSCIFNGTWMDFRYIFKSANCHNIILLKRKCSNESSKNALDPSQFQWKLSHFILWSCFDNYALGPMK